MPAASTFDYAIVRVVPRVERGEFLNAGVILHCRTQRYLGARTRLDTSKLLALCPGAAADIDEIERHLAAILIICEGRPEGGPIAALPSPERFHWLVAPRSTVIQVSPVHSGLCDDPAAALDKLFQRLVG